MAAKKSSKLVWVLAVVAGLSGAFIANWLLKDEPRMSQEERHHDISLSQFAQQQNYRCPKPVDEITRMDSVALQNNTLLYYYTFIHHQASDLDIPYVTQELKKKLALTLTTDSTFLPAVQQQASFQFHYNDKSGHTLFNIALAPKDYEP